MTVNALVARALKPRPEERIEALRGADLIPVDPIRHLCECSDPECRGHVRMAPEEDAAIHARPGDCMALAGRERPDVEVVVDRIGDRLLIVRTRSA